MIIDLLRKNTKKSTSNNTVGDRTIRRIIKAISWRIAGTLDAIMLPYLVTGKAVMVFSIGSLEVVTKNDFILLGRKIIGNSQMGRSVRCS